jgi:hypothetical protein
MAFGASFGLDGFVVLLIGLVIFFVPIRALADAISRTPCAFAAAGSSTGRRIDLIDLIVLFWLITGIIGLGLAIVYLTSVRPRVRAASTDRRSPLRIRRPPPTLPVRPRSGRETRPGPTVGDGHPPGRSGDGPATVRRAPHRIGHNEEDPGEAELRRGVPSALCPVREGRATET